MFGKNKYEYTCPDSIHDHAVAKRNAKITLAIYGLLYGGGYLAYKIQERKDRRTFEPVNVEIIPNN